VRYVGFRVLVTIFLAISAYTVFWSIMYILTAEDGIHLSIIVLNGMLSGFFVAGSRMAARWFLGEIPIRMGRRQEERRNAIIYGAGVAGYQLAVELTRNTEMRPVAFIDDATHLHGRMLYNLEIFDSALLPRLIEEKEIDEVLLAIPSVSRTRRLEIMSRLEKLPIQVRMLPGMGELAEGNIQVSDLREVDIIDLLGRDPVPPNEQLFHANVRGKVVMVTGAGGSIGSELCRQIARLKPKALILFEQNEFALYSIDQELKKKECAGSVIPVLGSVTDRGRVNQVCRVHGVETIYHAAAYKHVPMVEYNITEGLYNNVLGTAFCAQAAMESGVETFVLISTDKAVRPTNAMGASKRMAEMVLQGLADSSKQDVQENGPVYDGEHLQPTRFTMVRFGNVLGSSGSVVPLFKAQIRKGGPVTVTDPEITRYFMTIPEASQLVIQAGAMGKGGDVFVLDMGEPIKIADLARQMIQLSGLTVRDADNPDGDIEIVYSGLRPGEKLYEELLIGDDVLPTDHPRIMKAQDEFIPWERFSTVLHELEIAVMRYDYETLRSLLIENVKGYRPQCGIVDCMCGSLHAEAYCKQEKGEKE
jgi:FlaA1/EpsC-like NDP-sugar epimerase